MRKYLFVITCFILITLFHYTQTLTQETAEKADTKSFIWKVMSEKTTVYILGSIHLAKPSLYPLSESIENAFNESSKLVLEINPLTMDKTAMQDIVLKKGLYPQGETIEENISAEVWEMLKSFLNKKNITIELLQNMKPGMLAITLSTLQMMSLGYSPDNGIDIYFAKKSEDNKQILELESVEEQISMLLDAPDGNLLLKYSLMEMDNIEEYYKQIVKLWKEGDSEGLNNLILKPYENDADLKPILQRLFFERNIKITSKIKKYLNSDEKYFVVVGAGHLIGKKGIINLLRKENYKVYQL